MKQRMEQKENKHDIYNTKNYTREKAQSEVQLSRFEESRRRTPVPCRVDANVSRCLLRLGDGPPCRGGLMPMCQRTLRGFTQHSQSTHRALTEHSQSTLRERPQPATAQGSVT